MKTLLVLRHGKSSWSSSGLADHDRPLKGRGKRAARRMGQELRARDLVPDLIVSSTARRALSTARRAAETAGYDGDITETRQFYLVTVEDLLTAVAEHVEDEHDRVMIVGHNPTSEDLVEHLTGKDVIMTTANLACLDLDIASWQDVTQATGQLRFLLRPRELPPVS
ncbi:MAG: histidine phosphatase family protein [bacterium]|nr:histidine phosphatase family protein [bacterium]